VLQDNVADPATVAGDLVNGAGGSLLRVYTSAIKGFAARLSAPAAAALQSNPLVASVEADQMMRADVTQAMDANGDPWGLDRIDQGALPLSRTYTYTSTGAGVHAYIIDTGIWTLHPEFGRSGQQRLRCLWRYGRGLQRPRHPRVGHHWRGDVRSGEGGLAARGPGVELRRPWPQLRRARGRRLGDGAPRQPRRGEHVAGRRQVAGTRPGGHQSLELWCLPRRRGRERQRRRVHPVTVGRSQRLHRRGIERTDAKASYSNWGTCVELYAPGSAIKSTYLATTMSLSGTSMATPHVVGVAALYKATFGDAPSVTVSNWIITNSTTGVITGNGNGTPNRLLFKGAL